MTLIRAYQQTGRGDLEAWHLREKMVAEIEASLIAERVMQNRPVLRECIRNQAWQCFKDLQDVFNLNRQTEIRLAE